MPSELEALLIEELPNGLYPMLGVSVIHTPSGGPSQTVTGIVDRSFVSEASQYGGVWVRLSDFNIQPKRGDVLTIDSINYDLTQITNSELPGFAFLVRARQ